MQGSVYSSDSVHVGFHPLVQAPPTWGSSHAAGSAHDARLSPRSRVPSLGPRGCSSFGALPAPESGQSLTLFLP